MLVTFLTISFLISGQICIANAWDNLEIEMFDLVDEMNENFYAFLGIDHDAPLAEVKRAYHKLSLELHPDKNQNDPEAGKKFRQLALIYQILKDKDRRQAYDDVLEHGMPDWRTPVFYYRSLRKMSNTELAGISLAVAISIHMAALWGHVIEQRWTMRYKLESHLKRHKASAKRKVAIDIEIKDQLKKIPKPTLWDILPIALVRGIINLVKDTIIWTKTYSEAAIDNFKKCKQEKEEIKELKQQRELKKQEKAKNKTKKENLPIFDDLNSSIYQIDNLILTGDNISEYSDDNEMNSKSSAPWTTDEEILLIKLTNKYPGGFPNRWKKISEMMGRSTSDVTAKAIAVANKMPSRMQVNPDIVPDGADEEPDEPEEDYYLSKRKAKRAGIQHPSNPTISDGHPWEEQSTESNVADEELVDDEVHVSRKKQKTNKKAAVSKGQDSSAGGNWTQAEQNELEKAIKNISKDVPERWVKIAQCVPSKTLVEISARVKFLQESAKQKSTMVS